MNITTTEYEAFKKRLNELRDSTGKSKLEEDLKSHINSNCGALTHDAVPSYITAQTLTNRLEILENVENRIMSIETKILNLNKHIRVFIGSNSDHLDNIYFGIKQVLFITDLDHPVIIKYLALLEEYVAFVLKVNTYGVANIERKE